MALTWCVYVGPYFQTPDIKEVNIDDISRDLHESIFCWEVGDKLHWMPNVNRGQTRKFLLSKNECDINYDDFISDALYDEKDWLKEKFHKEWLYLNEKYNQDYDDIVKWGIFTFWW